MLVAVVLVAMICPVEIGWIIPAAKLAEGITTVFPSSSFTAKSPATPIEIPLVIVGTPFHFKAIVSLGVTICGLADDVIGTTILFWVN